MTVKQRQRQLKEYRAWAVLAVLQLAWIVPISYAEAHQEAVQPEMISEWEDVTRFDMYAVDEEVYIEPVETEIVKQAQAESLGTFKLTAYCSCEKCCGKTDGITATGTVATQGRTVAVDPKIIPYGTVLVIDGHEYVAEDCGGAIEKSDIDIFFDSQEEALKFGVQYTEVYTYADIQSLVK